MSDPSRANALHAFAQKIFIHIDFCYFVKNRNLKSFRHGTKFNITSAINHQWSLNGQISSVSKLLYKCFFSYGYFGDVSEKKNIIPRIFAHKWPKGPSEFMT